MVNRRNIIAAVCMLVSAAGYYLFIYESEEAKVKKRFAHISESIEKIPGENPIVGAVNVNRLKEAVADTLQINAPAFSVSKKIHIKDLSSYTLARRLHFKEISLDFYDFIIDFPGENVASVNVTARMTGQLTSGDYVEDIYELLCILSKSEDIWKLSELNVVETLVK